MLLSTGETENGVLATASPPLGMVGDKGLGKVLWDSEGSHGFSPPFR